MTRKKAVGKKHEPLTLGLLQGWLDIGAIGHFMTCPEIGCLQNN